MLDWTEKFIKSNMNTLGYYANISKLKTNADKPKTVLVWMYEMKISNLKFCPEFDLQWDSDSFKVLSIKLDNLNNLL